MSSYIEKARSIEQTLKFFPFLNETAQVSAPAVLHHLGGKVTCSISIEFPTKPSLEHLDEFRQKVQAFLAKHEYTLGETYLIEICLPSSVLTKYQIQINLN